MMATIGVVHYNTSPHKLNVLQQSSTNTNNSNNERREIIILRKTPHILPQSKDLDKEDILLTNTARKRPKNGKDVQKNPPPMAVARRNARERNRVKQVNNGFATLRQHIPHTIAAAFESTNGRGGNKKLSKVETLRMAVEYIRSLEDMLASDDTSENVSTTSSVSSFPSPPAPSSPALTTSTQMSFTYPVMSPSADSDDISTNPTPPPQQYIKINTSNNTYHLVPAHLYEDSENLEPLHVDEENLTSLIDADLQDLSLLHASDSLSPGMYSESSLSPPSLDGNNEFIPVFHSIDNLNVKVLEQQIKTEPINHQQLQQEENEALWWTHQERPSPS